MTPRLPLREALDWARDLAAYVPFALRRLGVLRAGAGDLPEQARRADVPVAALHPPRMKLRLQEFIDETPSTKTLRFERIDGALPPFRAGQYVNLFVTVDGVATSRPFSISSAPGAERLDLTVRAKGGGFVAPALLQLAPGTELECTGPLGSFVHEPLTDGNDLVFLAGGSGITPFMSLLRDQARRGWPLSIDLLYGTRSPDDVIFGAELERLAASTDRLRCTLAVSEPPKGYKGTRGLLDGRLLHRKLPSLEGRTFFICGPTPMYDLCVAELRKLGVPAHRIRRELYGPPSDVTKCAGWPADIAGEAMFKVALEDGREFPARAGEPLLVALERHGIVVPAQCRSGECSACRTRVLGGAFFSAPGAGVRESDRTGGYVHACVTYPLADLHIRL